MPGLIDDPVTSRQDVSLPDARLPVGAELFGPALAVVDPADGARLLQPAVSYRVLARKYRPTKFADLIGQDTLVRTLRNAFALKRVAHAFMLTGVRGVGKTTTARLIARALTCIGPDGQSGPTADPCGVCANCTAILADRHPDVQEMDAASRTGVDDVREIIEATRYRPMQARTKVFIVDEVHMLSRNAFNALLKTLEEPPPHVTFIFATTELRKVPITVLSRCQRFDLRRISTAELTSLFGRVATSEAVVIEPAALEIIARAADGSARDGLSLLDQAIAQSSADTVTAEAVSDMLGLADRTATFDLYEALMTGRTAEALAISERGHERGVDPGLLLQDLLELTHTLTRLKSVPALRDGSELPELERTRGATLADQLSIATLGRAWQMLLKGTVEVESAPDRRAAAEMVLIRLCYLAEVPTPGELVKRLSDAGVPPLPGGGGGRTVSGGGGSSGSGGGGGGVATARIAVPAPMAAPQQLIEPPIDAPVLGTFRDVVALVSERRDALLHAHLVHSVHLVRFAPPVIELRPKPDAPRDLASKLSSLLLEATGTRWTIALSSSPGAETIAHQGDTAAAARKTAAADHPMVRAILAAFPGAVIDAVNDSRTDAYGLTADAGDVETAPMLGSAPLLGLTPVPSDPDLEFAPDDAVFVEEIDDMETPTPFAE